MVQKGLLPSEGEVRAEKHVFSSVCGEHVSGDTNTVTFDPSLSRGGGVCEAVMVLTSCRERSTTHSATSLCRLGVCRGKRVCVAVSKPGEAGAPEAQEA